MSAATPASFPSSAASPRRCQISPPSISSSASAPSACRCSTASSENSPYCRAFVVHVSKAWAAWASLGIVLGAAYLLWLYQRTMFGPITHDVNKSLPDLNLREYAVLLPLVALAFWIGIYPKPFFAYIEKPVQRIVQQVNPGLLQACPRPQRPLLPILIYLHSFGGQVAATHALLLPRRGQQLH